MDKPIFDFKANEVFLNPFVKDWPSESLVEQREVLKHLDEICNAISELGENVNLIMRYEGTRSDLLYLFHHPELIKEAIDAINRVIVVRGEERMKRMQEERAAYLASDKGKKEQEKKIAKWKKKIAKSKEFIEASERSTEEVKMMLAAEELELGKLENKGQISEFAGLFGDIPMRDIELEPSCFKCEHKEECFADIYKTEENLTMQHWCQKEGTWKTASCVVSGGQSQTDSKFQDTCGMCINNDLCNKSLVPGESVSFLCPIDHHKHDRTNAQGFVIEREVVVDPINFDWEKLLVCKPSTKLDNLLENVGWP